MGKPAEAIGGGYVKRGKLVRMQKHLEELKILADVNDPVIRKRFEDGFGMSLLLVSLHLSPFSRASNHSNSGASFWFLASFLGKLAS